jgi:hypothetical protein
MTIAPPVTVTAGSPLLAPSPVSTAAAATPAAPFTEAEACGQLRWEWLRTVCAHEHWVALNLPSEDVMERPFDKLARFPRDL